MKKEKKKIETKKEKKDWFEPEGELVVDLYETEKDLVIISAIAGIIAEDLDILIEKDLMRIQGNRQAPEEAKGRKYFLQEIYWGPFSREIVLPKEVDSSRAKASMKAGILIIKIPKIEREKKKKIKIKEKE